MNNKLLLLLPAITMLAMSTPAQVKDKDGHVYKTIRIGTQQWMAENLNTSYFRNGDPIPEAKSKEEWSKAEKLMQPAWCYYDNDSSTGKTVGKLYNWFAVNDPRGLGPKGWHVASDTEWQIMYKFLGTDSVAWLKMKTTTGWSKGLNGTNESGFSVLPNNERANGGKFVDMRFGTASWWTSTELKESDKGFADKSQACYRVMHANYHSVGSTMINKNHGFYVRCIKN